MKLFSKLFGVVALAGSGAVGSVDRYASVRPGKLPVYIYVDEWSFGEVPVDQMLLKLSSAGATHLVLAFHVPVDQFEGHLADTIAEFAKLTVDARKSLMETLHAQGTEVYLSTGGETAGLVWYQKYTGEDYAKEVCGIAKDLGLDGVDFDLEHLSAGFGSDANMNKWMQSAISQCHQEFDGSVSSAPQQAYMQADWAGAKPWDYYPFDRHLIQYYNQGGYFKSEEIDTLFGNNVASVKSLMQRHPEYPKNAFVVGKPLGSYDASVAEPWISKTQLKEAGCKLHAETGWSGGFMFWKGHFDQETLDTISFMAKSCDGSTDVAPTLPPLAPPPTAPTPPVAPPTAPTPPVAPPTAPTPPVAPPTAPTPPVAPPTAPTPPVAPPTAPTPPVAPPTAPTPPSSPGGYPAPCAGVVQNAAVSECERAVHGTAGFQHFTEVCKGYCQVIAPGGCLNAQLCPGAQGSTGSGLTNCVKTQLSYCTDL